MESGTMKQEPMSILKNEPISTIIGTETQSNNVEALLTTLKKEPDNESYVENIKIENVKNELNSDNEVDSIPEIKTEEVFIKSEVEDSESSYGEDNVEDRTKRLSEKHSKSVMTLMRDKLYTCAFCEFKTYHRPSIYRHNLELHNSCSAEKYTCNFCDYTTSNTRYLKEHTLRKHDKGKDKRHACDQCDFRTIYKVSLQSHLMVMHQTRSVRNYACESCEYSTNYKVILQKHIEEKHGGDFVKKYACDRCEFKSHYQSLLNKHTRNRHKLEKLHKRGRVKRFACHKTHLNQGEIK